MQMILMVRALTLAISFWLMFVAVQLVEGWAAFAVLGALGVVGSVVPWRVNG